MLVADLPPGKLLGIGIGMPGLVDSREGVIRFAPDLGWKDIPVGRLFAERFNVPVTCLNRAKAAAYGEAWRGAGQTADSLIYISVSTGIAAGLVLNRRLYRGCTMSEGEIGHVTVIPDGPLCACGNRGCLQALAAGPAIVARVRGRLRECGQISPQWAGNLELLNVETIGQAASAGDPIVLSALDEVAEYLGIVAANLINILNPQMLVLGGAVIQGIPALVPRVEAVVRRRAMAVSAQAVRVVASQLGRDAVPAGAAAFLLSQVSPVASDGAQAVQGVHLAPQVLRPNLAPAGPED
jgi:glucokinase